MLKVAIVGCGKIADAHVAQIQRLKDCKIVAVCDREPLMADSSAIDFLSSAISRTRRRCCAYLTRMWSRSQPLQKGISNLPGSASNMAQTFTWRSLLSRMRTKHRN